MKQKFQVGDTVFLARAVWSGDPTDCPVCLGKCYVLVKPIGTQDSDAIECRCRYCDPRGDNSSGKVTDAWSWHPQVVTIKIEGVETREVNGGKTYKYLYNISGGCYNSFDSNNPYIFVTSAEARACAEEHAKKNNAKSAAEKYEQRTKVDFTWTAGYSKRELRDAKAALKVAKAALAEMQTSIDNHERRIERYKKELNIP
jgi:hypothetical protein